MTTITDFLQIFLESEPDWTRVKQERTRHIGLMELINELKAQN